MLKSETSNIGCFKRYFWLQSLFQTQHQLNIVQVLNFNTRQIIAPDEGRKCSRQLLVSWPINILLQSQPTQAWIQIIQFHVKGEPDVLHAGFPFNSSATCISHCMLTWTPELCITKYTHDNFHILWVFFISFWQEQSYWLADALCSQHFVLAFPQTYSQKSVVSGTNGSSGADRSLDSRTTSSH